MSDTTKGKPAKNKIIINQCKINDFKAMMDEASNAMDRVLEQRVKDLDSWGRKEQEEFYTIFGSRGERLVHVNVPIKGVKNIVEMKALDVMKDCVRRLKAIKETLTLDSYINQIYDPDNPDAPTNSTLPHDPSLPKTFCAYVNGEQQDNYQVKIGINFTGRISNGVRSCGKVMGIDSRVATLCHEISHFEKKFLDASLGGVGAGDYDINGRRLARGERDVWSNAQHAAGADLLVKNSDEKVFDNAYNLERYFQIKV